MRLRTGIIAVFIGVAGCVNISPRTELTVKQEAARDWYLPKLRLVEGKHEATNIDTEDPGARAALRDRLRKVLFTPGNFAEVSNDGPDVLTLEYRVIFFNGGDRGKRMVAYGISRDADGTILVEASFQHPAGHPLATLQARATIAAGDFGGSMSYTYEKVSREFNTYARNHFLNSSLQGR